MTNKLFIMPLPKKLSDNKSTQPDTMLTEDQHPWSHLFMMIYHSFLIYLKKNMMKKISVISGGSSGLGFAIAAKLLEAGKSVMILGRDNHKLGKAEMLLSSVSGKDKIFTFSCNIGNEDDVSRLGNYIKSNNLDVEFLFNNAGCGLVIKAEENNSELIDKVFESSLKGMILLTSEILRISSVEEELTIVNIMSTSALTGRPFETIYCAAKFGARGFTEALRAELKGKKRNIISVYPGGMRTPFWDVAVPDKDVSSFMDPEEVATKIVNAVSGSDKLLVTDITISRK
jgi:short-subunit dehydrogenase